MTLIKEKQNTNFYGDLLEKVSNDKTNNIFPSPTAFAVSYIMRDLLISSPNLLSLANNVIVGNGAAVLAYGLANGDPYSIATGTIAVYSKVYNPLTYVSLGMVTAAGIMSLLSFRNEWLFSHETTLSITTSLSLTLWVEKSYPFVMGVTTKMLAAQSHDII